MASTDKYAVYQDWINTINPDTAAEGRRALALKGLDTEDPFNNAPPIDQPSAYASGPDEVRAVRMQGGNEFNRLVAAGVPPPDALAQVAGKLFYNDPAGMTRAVNPRRSSTPPLPGSAPRFQPNVDPASGRVISYSVLNPDGRVQSTMRAPDLTMPQAAKDERSLIMQQIRGMQSSPMNIPGAANPELDALRNRFLELGTNWQSQAQPAMPLPPASFETKTFTETGPEGMSMRRLPVVRGKDTVESADSVRNMFRAGQITREEAKSRLKKLGFD